MSINQQTTGWTKKTCNSLNINFSKNPLVNYLLAKNIFFVSMFGKTYRPEFNKNYLSCISRPLYPTYIEIFKNSQHASSMTASSMMQGLQRDFRISETEYQLELYQRSNQETCLHQRPSKKVGEWVQTGDLLADSATSFGGKVSLGKNIVVAYMPWEGYNFEDAILINERLVYDDVYTSLHIERYEIETRETRFGMEQITNQIYEQSSDVNLVPSNNLETLNTVYNQSKKKYLPNHEKRYSVNSKIPASLMTQSSRMRYFNWSPSPKNLSFNSQILDTELNVPQITKLKEVKKLWYGLASDNQVIHLDNTGIIKVGVWVNHGDVLVGKITPLPKRELSPHEKLLYTVLAKEPPTIQETSLRVPKGVQGRVVGVQVLETEPLSKDNQFSGPRSVHVYLAVKRKLQVGDKMAGRHGNKGIVSKILPRQDMPYLPDGTPVDMVLNPLGVPSRMNVGQVFECLLGLAAKFLKQEFKITPFDEIYGPEASRSLVYSKLFEARSKTGYNWLFNPDFPGKTRLFDGRTSESFDQPVTVGQAYILKLVHLVDDKIHARSIGPYSLITQQPVRGRSKHGGQRLGEMEVWALEGFGAAYTLQEVLTIKSDDISGRGQVFDAILNDKQFSFGTPDVFRVLIRELRSLCLNVIINQETSL